MRSSLWLSWRELTGRKSAFLLNAALVGLAVGLCVAVELAARSREQAAQGQMYNIAPSIIMYPRGVTRGQIADSNTMHAIEERIVLEIEDRYGTWVHRASGRLVLKRKIRNNDFRIIGFDSRKMISPFKTLQTLAENESAAGFAMGPAYHIKQGDVMAIGRSDYTVREILPSTGTSEDAALFMTLKSAQSVAGMPGRINEISIYLRTGVSADSLIRILKKDYPGLDIIASKTGEIAGGGMETTLARHRTILYGMVGFITILLLFAGAVLNVRERRIEIATMYAVGASNINVLAAVACRSLIVGMIGSAAGCAAGALFMLAGDYDSALGPATAGSTYIVAMSTAVVITVLATMPAAILSGYQDHASILQEAQF